MPQTTLVKSGMYSDSVSLMRISGQLLALEGVRDALVGMATELNKELLQNLNAMTPEAAAAGPNDLMIAIAAENGPALEAALAEAEKLLAPKRAAAFGTQEAVYTSIREVADLQEGYNLAVVSVPGAYAARECRTALLNDIHVFLFSDNVTLDEEIALKKLAHERGLLMMGPDCGTAIVGGVPLGFANAVRRGDIGIVAASGTGLQHVTTLIDALGAGITQAIGTGGRDLSRQVGGITMLDGLEAIDADPATKVIVILSKPPSPEVAEKVLQKARASGKPVVLCLFGSGPLEGLGGITQAFTIEETACRAASLSLGRAAELADPYYRPEAAAAFLAARRPEQRFVRGVFSGGTLCDEAMTLFRREGIPIRSNIPLSEGERLEDVHTSVGNTFVDMGDDFFTRGRPHPMIDPALRNERAVRDALLPDTAAVLLDVVLGYGSHPDPAGAAAEAARQANARLGGRKILWIAAVVGTEADPQGFEGQIRKLLDAGFVVTVSSIRAAKLAAEIAKGGGAG